MSQEIIVKTCRKCEKELPIGQFRIRRANGGGLHIDNACKSCHGKSEYASLRVQMFDAMGWKCACCGETNPQFLTLEHINGDSSTHYYGRKDKVPAHRVQSSTYVEVRKAKRSGWDPSEYEILCMNCNFAKGHYGQCPHRLGLSSEVVAASLRRKAEGIGRDFARSMVEGGRLTRYTKGNPRPEMIGNKYAAHLTPEQVEQIKALKQTGVFQHQVAADFGISRAQVGMIWAGKRWAKVEVS